MVFSIRISKEEYMYITKKAIEKGMTKGEYIKRKVFGKEEKG